LISPIPNRRVISITEKKSTVGSEPLYVICDDYEPYFVKNSQALSPAWVMINEVICHYFLKEWDIITPSIALITLEAETIKANYGPKHKPIYYEKLAFGSKELDGAFDMSEFQSVRGKVDFKKYDNPIRFAHLGLFDMWVDNEDRTPNLKNMMMFERDEKYHFLAIDQAMAFRSGAYDSLKNTEFYPTVDNNILESTFFKELNRFLATDKELFSKERENFYLCIEKCRNILPEIVKAMPENWGFTSELETIMAGFLFNNERNEAIFSEYQVMLK
jgi:hypothetical protein